ncbi:NAD(P)-dependent oxidoreductase [Paenibacillus sp. NEAU-GSW1]|uniref:NAD(P)-dependent oxidoreductase n=1 Tax=Paenibacillus sp. NEAU-GSW1 TaxID=2682486 RepID=UPI0012E2EC2E|nr:SDR family oxidoreductase [Paenibacillus sp. NEAU-GSW1]MUT66536.1 NAD(P)H-binding protein [Paenibacillus sp. NEAU-GSW1]
MRITLLGATGRVGRLILASALQEGFAVTAIVRSPEKLAEVTDGENDAFVAGKLTLLQGSVLDAELLDTAVEGADAVVSALSTDGGTTLSDSVPLLIRAMEKHAVKRLIAIGTAGVLQSRAEPELLRYQSSESRRSLTRAAEEHHAMLQILQQSTLDWTLVCPTYLPEGEYTGVYRTERDFLPEGGKQISTGDTADFAFRLLSSDEWLHCRVGLAY